MIIQVEIDTLFPLGAIVRQVVEEVHRANRGDDDPVERYKAGKRYARSRLSRGANRSRLPLDVVMSALIEHEMAFRQSQRRSMIAKQVHARRKAKAEADAPADLARRMTAVKGEEGVLGLDQLGEVHRFPRVTTPAASENTCLSENLLRQHASDVE